ncbi:MAG: hypothetical protein JNN30_05530 [Rhodanobacteraceae bacterium]|nr:hypothetical protein [Rhodanobacteraceae bacterium]
MNSKSSPLTVADELKHLLGSKWKSERLWEWPPDLFAVCAWLLEVSGGYVRVLEDWPPNSRPLEKWVARIEKIANEIRRSVIERHSGQPAFANLLRVPKLWRVVRKSAKTPVADINKAKELSAALIELVAIADLACVGFGIPPINKHGESELDFYEWVQWNLTKEGTLSPRFPTTRLTVLPKQHTPQSGITLRSLTHNLALFTGGEVQPAWSVQQHKRGDRLNLLVVPWPFDVMPRQFTEAEDSDTRHAKGFKCFDFEVRSTVVGQRKASLSRNKFERWLINVFDGAEHKVGSIHGVVFPEAALTPKDFDIVNKIALERGAFLIAGVAGGPAGNGQGSGMLDGGAAAGPKRGTNEVWMSFGPEKDRDERIIRQGKHHRWQLNRSQLEMYGLAGNLDPRFKWWENMTVGRRDVNFVSLHAHMTICGLVCEDLARQDPVSNLVRAVGPNLVIALLSDGPQLQTRWPSRYATVLADDPGSSVLTVTNLGMTQLAAPPAGMQRSRSVALWKDAAGGQREIELAEGASAVVLNLWTSCAEEWTADGRSDSCVAAFPTLGGVHQVKVADVPRL